VVKRPGREFDHSHRLMPRLRWRGLKDHSIYVFNGMMLSSATGRLCLLFYSKIYENCEVTEAGSNVAK
jgi:hypothetical protein